jgi:hypothetical protein
MAYTAKKDPGEIPGIKLVFRFQPVFLTGYGFLCNGPSMWMV